MNHPADSAVDKGKVMKILIFAMLLMAWLMLPAYAGQLLIKETETAIIVEYTGDPTDTGKTNTLEDQSAFKKLGQLAGHTPAVVTATNIKDSSKSDEEKKKFFETAKKLAEESRSRKWSGKTAAEKYN
jgi:hypothetical protein